MENTWCINLAKEYKDFQVVKRRHSLGGGYTNYYMIYLHDEPYSTITLTSVKACENVIDTHLRNLSENQKPIYR